MKTLRLQKRMAAYLLGVGINKVWIDPDRTSEVKEAITKADIATLIKDKIIKKKPTLGVKRRAGRAKTSRKKKGYARGFGRKRQVVAERKTEYMHRIRKLRRYINMLKESGAIDSRQSKKLKRIAKSGIIKSKKEIRERIGK